MKEDRNRSVRGQSLVETMTAFFVLIPLGLVGVDIVALVSASQQNEQLAEMACRAAATRFNLADAKLAAQDALDHFQPTGLMSSVLLDDVQFDPVRGVATVATKMDVHLPVPFPFFNQVNCRASSLQPIVSQPVVN